MRNGRTPHTEPCGHLKLSCWKLTMPCGYFLPEHKIING
ncbi:Protein of unknown function [Pyronema omphalodes CBS 100304]|uniref:Uncharacterized protein n=1 Tax=Pyronema omphalodes (strain CBS 100304) TaxID=1076935 RepID=U4LKD5_PYROM|nr:Protein of unknown function [Pyronema omphalodes CBS 100304]